MKKFLLLIFAFLFMGLVANAGSFDRFLDNVNKTMDKVDRTEYTMRRIKNAVPNIPTTTTTTTGKNSNRTTTVTPKNTTSTTSSQSSNYEYEDVPEYSVEQTSPEVQEGNHKYNQDRVYKGEGTTLGALPAGVIVMDPNSVWKFRRGDNYSGEILAELPVFWRKLEDNHYSDGSTLLLSEFKVAAYPFCHSKKGLRAWDESDVRRFLRTTFYNHLSTGFKNAIVNTNIPYADMNGVPKTINDNFFLLSIVEWGLSDRTNNGTVIKYDNLPEIYGAKDIWYVNSWKSFFITNAGRSIKTRTINRPEAKSAGYTNDVFDVTTDGVLTTSWSASNLDWVRPAVNLKSSTKVTGPYKFKHNIEKKESLIYYVLDFSGTTTSTTSTTSGQNYSYSISK